MPTRRGWIGAVLLLLAVSSSFDVAAASKRRAVAVPFDAITIIQTTDIHDHANGAGHTGLDVDPSTATSVNGSIRNLSLVRTVVLFF